MSRDAEDGPKTLTFETLELIRSDPDQLGIVDPIAGARDFFVYFVRETFDRKWQWPYRVIGARESGERFEVSHGHGDMHGLQRRPGRPRGGTATTTTTTTVGGRDVRS